MRTKPLGESGIEASVVGLGTWAIGGWMWGGTDEADSVNAVHAAIDEGITLVDTAPMYGMGRSEEIVGKALRGRRDKAVLATKCGLVWHVDKGDYYFATDRQHVSENGDTAVYKYLGPESIRYEVEQSLKRLQTDYIDLYQTHWQESATLIADTMGELLKLRDEGKIRAIGVSNVNPTQLEEYRAAGPVHSDQEKYSMLDRKHEKGLLPYCKKHGLAFLAYSPLAQGLLTGKVGPERTFSSGDQRNRKKRFSAENRQKITDMLDEFRPVADRHSMSLAQLAVAWTVHQPGCSHALIGARTQSQGRESAGAGEVVLDQDDLDLMTAALDRHTPDIT